MAGYRTPVPPGVLLTHPSSLQHDTGPHPERAARIVAIERALEARSWLGWERMRSSAVARDVLERVHPARYVEAIERLSWAGGGALDPDTVASEGTFDAALHGAGGAVQAVDLLLGGEAPVAASLHRPPGHHAESARAMGFCFFNNVAVAARRALDRGAERVLIVDWDVHHGNGTNDIFHAEPSVLFVSVHESPLYPGTGPASDVGSGAGEGYTVNVPVRGRSGDETWCSLVEHVAVPLARAFAPDLLLISAGYDGHVDDPLATCRVTDDGFAAMAASVRRVALELSVPVGLVLEGGYNVDALSRSVVRTLEALGSDEFSPADPSLAVHPIAAQTARRLADRWPALAAAT
jgi:acetoin utilization deacetylase AcuC-like enzyme